MVRPISRETTSAMYITPANCSSITSARAHGLIGRTSPRPKLDSVVKLQHRRGRQQPCDPVDGRAANHDPERQGQDQHPERAEQRPPGAGILHQRIQQQPEELHGQQRPRRMAAQSPEPHGLGH